jgi:hypothetical protein
MGSLAHSLWLRDATIAHNGIAEGAKKTIVR